MDKINKILFSFIFIETAICQISSFSSSDPANRLFLDSQDIKNKTYSINIIRPIVLNKPNQFYSSFSITNFYNSGFTNLENSGSIISYPQRSTYSHYTFSYYNDFLYFKIIPTYKKVSKVEKNDKVVDTFSVLNEKMGSEINGFDNSITESTFSVHYKNLGFGISNESMWFGPGFHSSISMSNNSEGLLHKFIGTLKEKRIKDFGLSFRYFISENNQSSISNYHTAISSALTYYNNPTITAGFNRVFLSGGIDEINWSEKDAMNLVFQPLFGENIRSTYKDLYPNEPAYWDPWDQMISVFFNLFSPENKASLYLELSTDDSRANFTDLRAHWDHALGYLIGYKKYGLFNNDNLFFGIESFSVVNTTNTRNPLFYRGDLNIPNFYNKDIYDYSSYNGRRWAAHSGSDSNDNIIILGYNDKSRSFFISYNYERRGVVSKDFPEKKNQLAINYTLKNEYYNLTLYFENDKIINYDFVQNSFATKSNVIGTQFIYFINGR